MISLITFSDLSMDRSRQLCMESALKHGVDLIAGPHYFDPALEYRDGFSLEWLKSQPIYEQMGADWWTQRGIGYWLWKPFLIDLIMSKVPDGDFIVYADAGIEFIDNVSHIIDRMGPMEVLDVMLLPERKAATGGTSDIWLFGNNWEHAYWCKRDVVEAIMPWSQPHARAGWGIGLKCQQCGRTPPCMHFADGDWAAQFGKQAQASVIVFRVSDYSRKFVKEWLDWCSTDIHLSDENGYRRARLIDDSPSMAPNHPEFREHRHDQAILTTLAYREGIKLHYWPAVYNKGGSPEFVYEKLPEYAGDTYPVLFSHHRRRNHEFTEAA